MNTIYHQGKEIAIDWIAIFEVSTAIAVALLVSVSIAKFRLAVIEFEAETPHVPYGVFESEPYVKIVQTRMPLQYALTSFKAPLQQPISVLLRDVLKPLKMPTEYSIIQYELLEPL